MKTILRSLLLVLLAACAARATYDPSAAVGGKHVYFYFHGNGAIDNLTDGRFLSLNAFDVEDNGDHVNMQTIVPYAGTVTRLTCQCSAAPTSAPVMTTRNDGNGNPQINIVTPAITATSSTQSAAMAIGDRVALLKNSGNWTGCGVFQCRLEFTES